MFTVLGASGFIGSHLLKHLRCRGFDCFTPAKFEDISGYNCGYLIDCTGLSADFRTRPFETVEAHVCHTLKMLRQCKFDSFLYLSTTRVYGTRDGTACEEDIIYSQPLDSGDLYNISKMMGESLCFASGIDNVKVARLSNVYGCDDKSENFMFSLIRDALGSGEIVLNTSLDSSKDHISVHDVVNILPEIAVYGRREIYNIASGENIVVGQIVDVLSRLTGCSIKVNENAERVCSPDISISRVKEEFSFEPSCILGNLESLIQEYRNDKG